MAVYVVADVHWNDESHRPEYRRIWMETMTRYGGRVIASGHQPRVLEGNWPLSTVVILEFPSEETLDSWLSSPEYSPAAAIRHRDAITRSVVLNGVSEA
jgi:uncharacterized protein (DUF1330 family)